MKAYATILKNLAQKRGEFGLTPTDDIRHTWAKCSAFHNLNTCPLAFLMQQEGEYANNDDFEKFADFFNLTKDEVADFVTATDFHTALINSAPIKELRRSLLYELRLKESVIPSHKNVEFINKLRGT